MKNFKGTIADKKLGDFKQYDNSLEKFQDRLKLVEGNIMEGEFLHEFFATYFNQYYDVSPSQTGYLAEQDAVCKLLESLGTYLIEAKDTKSHRKVKYKFWVDEREYRKHKESENATESLLENKNSANDNDIEVIDMFVDKKNDKNQKIVKDVEVNKEDIKSIKEILEIEKAIEYLKSPKGEKDIKEHALNLLNEGSISEESRNRLKYISNNVERYIASYAKDLRANQLAIKIAITKPVSFSDTLKDEGVPHKLDAIDFDNQDVVREVLKSLGKSDLMTDFGTIVYDLNVLIDEIDAFKDDEKDVIELFREGLTQADIVSELKVDRYKVTRIMDRISKKVVNHYINKKITF